MLNRRIVTISVVLIFTMVLGVTPVVAATTTQSSNALEACTYGSAAHALGVEGGLLSLLNAQGSNNPDPIAEIIRSGDYSVGIGHSSQATDVAYDQINC